jgi:hypothetical protein
MTENLTLLMKTVLITYDTYINSMKCLLEKTSRLATHTLPFQSSLCHRFLGFVYPRNSWPSSTIPSSRHETHHFLQSYFGQVCNVSISMCLYHMK